MGMTGGPGIKEKFWTQNQTCTGKTMKTPEEMALGDGGLGWCTHKPRTLGESLEPSLSTFRLPTPWFWPWPPERLRSWCLHRTVCTCCPGNKDRVSLSTLQVKKLRLRKGQGPYFRSHSWDSSPLGTGWPPVHRVAQRLPL